MKNQIKDFILQLGADDVGFCSVDNYQSSRSPKIKELFPDVQTIIVIAIKEMSHCESPNSQMRSIGRSDIAYFAQSCRLKLAQFLETDCKAKAMTIPNNYPLDMTAPNNGFIGEVSLRHAAVGAGLGVFGRHNLVIHPRLGTQVFYTGVLTDLAVKADSPLNLTEELCINCDICVANCPVGALDKENFTDAAKCIKHAQPYGLGKAISFGKNFLQAAPEEQRKLLTSTEFMQIYHVLSFGMHYECFNCYTLCPIGKE